jgi:two-component system CheB/CheR fusion protein
VDPDRSPYSPRLGLAGALASSVPELERVIRRVSEDHGFDIRGYKRSTLYRRLLKRMGDSGAADVEEYLQRLESDSGESTRLMETIFINVTEFFRDPDAWEHLQQECLATLVARKAESEPFRAWSVGCATGEEAYSLVICLADLLGPEGLARCKVFATDVDEDALSIARSGVYPPEVLRNVSQERLDRYFVALPGKRFALRRELRSAITFGTHNVLADPPISRLDLLICRNVLIYFLAVAQHCLLPRFHYALREEGLLFLGKAETLLTRSHLFRAVEPRHRLFQRDSIG